MKKPLTAHSTNWPDDFDKEDRVHTIAGCIRQPRSTDWIAERADVNEGATRSILHSYDAVRPLHDDDDTWMLDGPQRYYDATKRIHEHIRRWLERSDDTPVDIDDDAISEIQMAAKHAENAASLLKDADDESSE